MRSIENAVIGVALGAAPIITGFVAGWWLSIPLVPEPRIVLCALAGLCVGVLVDGLFLRTWIRRAYLLKPWVWKALYALYSVGMFGFFMGVPVFNTLLALPAGVFVGRWLAQDGADAARTRKTARKTAGFTTGMLGLVCIASGSIALASASTASDLRGLLGVSFRITPVMIWGVIVVGGSALLTLNWWLAVKSVERTFDYFRVRAASTCAL